MTELLPFFIVLFAGLFFSELFLRFRFPWVVALIIGGWFIGPYQQGYFIPNETIEFLGQIGLIFLMFMAGLETNLLKSDHRPRFENILKLSILNGVIPFVAGVLVGIFFDYSTSASLFLGTIFMSSSIAVIVPSLEANNLLRNRLGRTMISSVILVDVASLVILSVILQSIEPVTKLPLPVFYALLVLAIIILKSIVPKIRWFLKNEIRDERDIFQQELRSIIVILVGIVIVFEILGLHPIIAGFFAGLVMSGTVGTSLLKEKLRGISYGIFIPTFFILVGSRTDISSLWNIGTSLNITVVVVLVSIFSKFISGYFGSLINGQTNKESLILGSATIPQLSTTLAVAFSGLELGILDEKLATAMVILSLVTTLVGPFLVKIFSKNYIRDEVEFDDRKLKNNV